MLLSIYFLAIRLRFNGYLCNDKYYENSVQNNNKLY